MAKEQQQLRDQVCMASKTSPHAVSDILVTIFDVYCRHTSHSISHVSPEQNQLSVLLLLKLYLEPVKSPKLATHINQDSQYWVVADLND